MVCRLFALASRRTNKHFWSLLVPHVIYFLFPGNSKRKMTLQLFSIYELSKALWFKVRAICVPRENKRTAYFSQKCHRTDRAYILRYTLFVTASNADPHTFGATWCCEKSQGPKIRLHTNKFEEGEQSIESRDKQQGHLPSNESSKKANGQII